LDNLVLLCRRHHRLVHEGGYGVDRRLRFYDPRGRLMRDVPALPRGDAGVLVSDTTIGPRMLRVSWPDRMDLEMVVTPMLGAGRREAA
jgi:hypothetical protein